MGLRLLKTNHSSLDHSQRWADLDSTLQQLGLKECESRALATLLRIGGMPASLLARQLRLSRGKTYRILSSLTARRLVVRNERNTIACYTPAPTEQLLEEIRKRELEITRSSQRLQELLPSLMSPQRRQAQVSYASSPEEDLRKQLLKNLICETKEVRYLFCNTTQSEVFRKAPASEESILQLLANRELHIVLCAADSSAEDLCARIQNPRLASLSYRIPFEVLIAPHKTLILSPNRSSTSTPTPEPHCLTEVLVPFCSKLFAGNQQNACLAYE